MGGVKLFHYPTGLDPCLLVRTDADSYVAYSRRCTHLACAVYFMKESGRLGAPRRRPGRGGDEPGRHRLKR